MIYCEKPFRIDSRVLTDFSMAFVFVVATVFIENYPSRRRGYCIRLHNRNNARTLRSRIDLTPSPFWRRCHNIWAQDRVMVALFP